MNGPIPWNDAATLVRTSNASIHDGGRAIVAEGSLDRLLALADALPPAELDRHFIALPDRRAAPHRLDPDAIRQLLGRIDRPALRLARR